MSPYDMSNRRILVIRYGTSNPHIIRDGSPKHIQMRYYQSVTDFVDCCGKSVVLGQQFTTY